MPKPEKNRYGRLGWFVPPIMLACAALGNVIGDMILICGVYGRQAYFEQGLRIVKHKPFTLSTGVVLSQHLDEIGWLIDVVLSLGLTILCVWVLTRAATAFRDGRERSTAATPR
jgi:hypothetical protein